MSKPLVPSTGCTFERPHWGSKQVRALQEILVGQICLKIKRLGSTSKIIILSKPFRDDSGDWKFRYTDFPVRKESFLNETFCSDSGILPYDNGSWNEKNYLLRTGQNIVAARAVWIELLLKNRKKT